MPVKSRSKTFKPGDNFESVDLWIQNETDDAVEFDHKGHGNIVWWEDPIVLKKRLTITITYDRDVPEKV